MHSLHAAPGPLGGEEPGDGDLGDVAGSDPWHRMVERQQHLYRARADRVELEFEVGEEVAAA